MFGMFNTERLAAIFIPEVNAREAKRQKKKKKRFSSGVSRRYNCIPVQLDRSGADPSTGEEQNFSYVNNEMIRSTKGGICDESLNDECKKKK